MQLTETAKVRLLIDGKEAISELTQMEARFIDVNNAKKAFTRGTEDWKALNNEAKELKVTIGLLRERMDVANMTFDEANRYQKDLRKAMKGLKEDTDDYIAGAAKLKEVNTRLAKLNSDFTAVDETVKKTKSTWENLKDWIATAFTIYALQQFLTKVWDVSKGVFDITAKFERYDAVLANATQSTALATKAMGDIKEMAATTPFTVDELTDSYVKFANRGLMPTKQEMKAMANVAATTGKSFEQLSEALLDGAMGQLKRFTELGISAEKMGDKIKLSFKGVSTTVSMDLKGMTDAMSYFNENAKGVATATDVMSKTMEGRMSNLQDLFDFARVELGNKLKPMFSSLIDIMYKMVEGLRFVAQNFERIGSIVKIVTAAFVAYHVGIRLESGLLAINNGLMTVRRVLYGQYLLMLEAVTGMTIAETEAQIAATTAARNFNAAIAANPGMVILGVLTLLATAYQVYKMNVEDAQRKHDELNKKVSEGIAPLILEKEQFNLLAKEVLNTNLKLDDRKTKLDELKKKYPDNLKGINDLKDAEQKLGAVIRDTNKDFVTRAKMLENEVKINYNNSLATAAIEERIRLENQLKNTKDYGKVDFGGNVIMSNDAAIIKEKIAAQDKLVQTTQKNNAALAKYSEELTKKLKFDYKEQELAAAGAGNGEGKAAKERKATAEKLAKDLEKAHKDMLEAIKKANDLADKNIRKSLADHLKAVKSNNTEERKAHEQLQDEIRDNALSLANFKDNALKLERIKKATSLAEIERIEKEFAQRSLDRELQASKDKLAIKEREFYLLKAAGVLYKAEEDRRSKEILSLKNDVAEKEIAIIKKNISEEIKEVKDGAKEAVNSIKGKTEAEIDLELKKAERIKQIQQELARVAYDFVQKYLSNTGDEIDALIDKTNDKVEKARLESRKISNEMGKSFIDTVASFATGDISGGISGLIGVLSGAVDLFNQNARILVAELEVLYDKLAADANFLMSNVEAVKSIYGDMAFNMPSFEDYSKVTSAIEASISAEIKVGQQIQDNYELAASKENDYFEQRKKSIEDAYALDVQRINNKYDLLAQKANQAQNAESLALIESGNNAILALITNEDSKTSIMAEYSKKRSNILRDTAMADMQITDDMDAATIKAINDARDLREKSLSDLGGWYQQELVFIVNNEGQKRKEYSATDVIINKLKEDQNALDLKYAMLAIEREKEKTQELVKSEKDKNTALENEAKRHNDELTRLGIEKDDALTASFNRLKDAMNSGYQEMIDNAERLYQKGIITANQFIELVNQIRYFKSLLNDGGYTDTGTPTNVPFIEPVVIPRFGDGGMLRADDYFENHGVLGGLSHNTPEGGNWVVNARTGRIQAKVEAGEWMGIINKNTTAKYKNLLSTLAKSSVATTGTPVYAEKGYFGTPTPVDAPTKSFVSTSTALPVFDGFGELVGLMRQFITKVEMSNELLGAVAVSSEESAKKRLVLSVNSILDAADVVADVDSRSSFM
jgi:hypothetical protein